MKSLPLPCRHEAAVLANARHGRAHDDELATHPRACVTCAGAAATGAALRQAAAVFTAEAQLPDSQELLRRAVAERHRLATERVLLPLRLAKSGAIAAGAAAGVVLLPPLLSHWRWPALTLPRNLLPASGPAWVAMGALLLALIVAAVWLHWEEA
ncbi:MAG TPA: hypothetical protein VFS60_00715 [Thermoanaerobaculia bacterium]|nr:hypothetical protein [Thermoanaerobaculia bacterium]